MSHCLSPLGLSLHLSWGLLFLGILFILEGIILKSVCHFLDGYVQNCQFFKGHNFQAFGSMIMISLKAKYTSPINYFITGHKKGVLKSKIRKPYNLLSLSLSLFVRIRKPYNLMYYNNHKKVILNYLSILLFKGFLLFGFLIFQFKNILTPLCLSRAKIKRQFGKNAILTSIKTLPKKQGHSSIDF